DLYIGTNADEDVMKFIDDTSVQFTVALDVDAAFTASTVASDGDVSGTTLTPSDDVTIADTKS
ncbi:MAG: hypothetical protein GWN76_11715, partial [candidate division Zixibacteria bacterium]|nr:hypothetical protein [candidate division Zixibacteria bacterium]NIS46533.1 hypothetical protein [candidate division Zixibacteria bacterium]NIU14649.1 hypothetical protein [candidate division Zixibacteria bacterium]NIW47966.1 hypothetical protein [Gammaproteobacteria bacterium]NIX02526.1 hypothetical protein [Phycisphaerae bacterium]